MQSVNRYNTQGFIFAQNKQLNINNTPIIILDDIEILGLSNFNLVINNSISGTSDKLIQVSFYAKESEEEDYFLIKDNSFPYGINAGEVDYYSFSILFKKLRITAQSNSSSIINVYLHGNPV